MVVVMNSYYGQARGVDEFQVTADTPDACVNGLYVWTRNGPGDHEILQVVRVFWDDDTVRTIGSPDGPAKKAPYLEKGDPTTKRSMFAGDYLDAIYIESERNPSGTRLGGSGGVEETQKVGHGRLMGFWGTAASDIGALGTLFEEEE